MRTLRVVGLDKDGNVIVEDTTRGERFILPSDERLRAAVRQDLSRLNQIELELENKMRPREIQTRIRAGESIAQVAAAADMPEDKVERFAHPVLLERQRTAEAAVEAHPVQTDGPDVRSLAEVVQTSFHDRGHDYGSAEWDSWRGEDGHWVLQLRWHVGRSDNHAHWIFHPGAHGGTVTAIDDYARSLVDPLFQVQPVKMHPVIRPNRWLDTPLVAQTTELTPIELPTAVGYGPSPAPTTPTSPPPPSDDVTDRAQPVKRHRNGSPIMPSWEDVLLGVRKER
jgi:hypothetical protein